MLILFCLKLGCLPGVFTALPQDFTPLAWCQTVKFPFADPAADQAQGREAHLGCHAAHLAVLALADGDFQPAGGDVLAEADGRRARPQAGRLVDDFCRSGLRDEIAQIDTLAQLSQRFRGGRALHLRPVSLGLLVARVADFVLQFAIIG